MRSLMVRVTLAAGAIITASFAFIDASLGAQKSAEQEVLQAQADRFRAAIARDIKALERHVANELWYCRASGVCEDKAHYLELVRQLKNQSMEPSNLKATVHGDAAMVTGRFDQDRNLPFLILETYVKRDGRWQLTKHQPTDIPGHPHRCNQCKDVKNATTEYLFYWPEANPKFEANPYVSNLLGHPVPGERLIRWRGPYLFGTEGAAERDVLQAQAKRFQAHVAGDAQAAAGMLADGLRYCRADGHCEDKATYLKSPEFKAVSMKPEDAKVNVYGNLATVIGLIHQMTASGPSAKPDTHTYRILEVYVKDGGRWQLAGGMETDPPWSRHRCGACS